MIKHILIFFIFFQVVTLLDNGLARTPPMGFLTWERYRCITDCITYPDDCISHNLIETTAKIMASHKYLKAGYKYVIIDDCWSNHTRDKDGNILADEKRFPHGMKKVAQYVNSLGLQFGIYGDIGTKTCGGYPGMAGRIEQDLKTYASWGVGYLKLDGCYIDKKDMPEKYAEVATTMKKLKIKMVYSCSWPAYVSNQPTLDYKLVAKSCNLWRSYGDISDSSGALWSIINHYINKTSSYTVATGPGAWNDPDMLLIGNFGLSHEEEKTQMAIWCIMPAPLLMSTNLKKISYRSKRILLNKLAIKINQDKLGAHGRFMGYQEKAQIWCRPLSDGLAVAIVRPGGSFPTKFNFSLLSVGVEKDLFVIVSNVFEHTHRIATNYTELWLNPYGTQFLKIMHFDKTPFFHACMKLKA